MTQPRAASSAERRTAAPTAAAGAAQMAPVERVTRDYEARVEASLGTRHAVSFAFARHGLLAILTGLGVKPGDEIILPPLTCKVVPLALQAAGVTPVYADIDPDTLNLDPEAVGRAIGSRTRGILFQHTYGSAAGVTEIASVAAEHAVPLIEDCAQCLPYAKGAWQPGRTGIAAIFSNNLGKPLSVGSGGLAVTDDDALANAIRACRAQLKVPGRLANFRFRVTSAVYSVLLRPERYWSLFDAHRRANSDYRIRSLDDEIERGMTRTRLRASAVQVQRGVRGMQEIGKWADHRLRCCTDYRDALRGTEGIEVPTTDVGAPLYYFPVLVPDKPSLLAEARRRRTEVIPWPLRTPIYPIEREADLRTFGYEPESCPRAEDIARRLVGLPTHLRITATHRRAAIELLRQRSGAPR